MLEVFKKDNLSVISILKNKLTETTYNTWIDTCVPKAYLDKDVIIIPFQNDFSKEVVKSRYSELINSTYKLISNYKSYEIKYEVIKN
jgi:chromosomal replication initiation ATPase DnaA